MKCDKEVMLLYAVTDRMWTGEQTLYEQVEAALKGGVTCVQLREKDMDDESFYKEAVEIRKLCHAYNVPLFINDNVNVAVRCRADGIHVGQDDMPASEVRKLVGEDMMIGVSVHNAEEAVKAVEDGADCLGAGAVFTTSTKPDAEAMKRETLQEICKAVDVPVVAIGGISKANMKELSGTGIAGVALVSAVFGAKDIEKECIELKKLSEKTVNA